MQVEKKHLHTCEADEEGCRESGGNEGGSTIVWIFQQRRGKGGEQSNLIR